MDNIEYIKTLEQRIEKLESLFKKISIEKDNGVSFTNCQIQAVAMEKCKGSSITDNEIENVILGAFNSSIDNCSIHNLKNANAKSKFNNCNIHNKTHE